MELDFIEAHYPEIFEIIVSQDHERAIWLRKLTVSLGSPDFTVAFVAVWNSIGRPMIDFWAKRHFGYEKIQKQIEAAYPESRGEIYRYDDTMPTALFDRLDDLFGRNNVSTSFFFMLRNVYGELALESLTNQIGVEDERFTPLEIIKILEKWDEIGHYPLKWALEIHPEIKSF